MAADDDGSSGSSTRMESTHLFLHRNCLRSSPDEGSVPSSQPPRQVVLPSSPIHGGRAYSLRSTPEWERRVVAVNNQQEHPAMVLTQLAAVSSERSPALRQQQQQPMAPPQQRQQV
jgi:hypothetical protein